jgi:WD40 repeat protein
MRVVGIRPWFSSALLAATVGWAMVPCAPAQAPAGVKPKPRLDAYGDPLPDFALGRLGTSRLRSPDYLGAADLSPDGKLLASTGNRIDINIHEVAGGKLLRTLKAGYVNGNVLTWTPDGKALVFINGANELVLLDADSGKVLHRWTPPNPQRFAAVAFSADARIVACCAYQLNAGGSVVVAEVNGGKQLAKVDVLQNYRVLASLSKDGKLLATWGQYIARAGEQPPGDYSRTLQLWDVASSKELHRIKMPQGNAVAAALSPDGKRLAASNGKALTVFDTSTGKKVTDLDARQGLSGFVEFAPDGKQLAAGTVDCAVFLWEVATWKSLGSCAGGVQRSPGLVFRPKGPALGWGIDGQAVRIWEVPSGKTLTPSDGHLYRISSLAFADQGKTLWSTSAEGRLCRWEVASGKLQQQLSDIHNADGAAPSYGGNSPYWAVQLSADSRVLVTGSRDASMVLDIWDRPGLKITRKIDAGLGQTSAMALSADGALVALGGRDGVAHVVQADGGKELYKLQVPAAEVRKLAFSRDGSRLAVAFAYYDRNANQEVCEVHVVKATTGDKVCLWKRPRFFPSALALSADGSMMAVATQPGPIELVDASKGQEIGSIAAGPNTIFQIAFAPDGRTLAASASYGLAEPARVFLCELATRTVRCTFSGHTHIVDQLAFTPDCRVLASGGNDTTILLWALAGQLEAKPDVKVLEKDGARLWADLASSDGATAYKAMLRLYADPEAGHAVLKQHAKAVPRPDLQSAQIDKLIADLDADKYSVRDSAEKSLAKLGIAVVEQLRKELAAKPSPEKKKRLETLLARWEKGPTTAETLQVLRVVEVLERLATPEARKLLTGLAEGLPAARLTQEARAALKRLGEADQRVRR